MRPNEYKLDGLIYRPTNYGWYVTVDDEKRREPQEVQDDRMDYHL